MKLVRPIQYWRPNRQSDAGLAEEMEFHGMMKERDSGVGADADRRAMGNIMPAREDGRAVWIRPRFEHVAPGCSAPSRSLR
jgi:hypothetical protein